MLNFRYWRLKMPKKLNKFPFIDYYHARIQVEGKDNLEVGQKIGMHDSDTITYDELYTFILDYMHQHESYINKVLNKFETDLDKQRIKDAENLASMSSLLFNFLFDCLGKKKILTETDLQKLNKLIEENTQ